MLTDKEELRRREQAEIERRASNALQIKDSDLRISGRTFERYQAPPADAAFAIEYAYNLLGDVRGKDVLDLDCGDGENTILLVNRGANVCGLDISDALIRIARRRMQINGFFKGFKFGAGSAHQLPFPDGSFDVVFGMAALHHFNLELVSQEVWRVLRPGGYAIFKEPVRNSRFLRLIRRMISYRVPSGSPFLRPLTDQELKRFIRRFSQCHSRAYQLPFVNVARWFPIKGAFAALFYQFDHALLNRAEWLRWYATVRVIKVVK
ncbi:MAG: class I SAM-dependent methyltransferase [Blastocatellia bacterium]